MLNLPPEEAQEGQPRGPSVAAEQPNSYDHPPTPQGQVRLTLERVAAAADALGAIRLQRAQTSAFIRWLVRKRAGLTATAPAIWDGAVCESYAQDMLAVPGSGDLRYYNPLNQTAMGTDRSDWPIQVLFSQLLRERNKLEQRLYKPAEALPTGLDGPRGRVTYRQEVLSPEAYASGLEKMLPTRKVPIADLAVWRYRYTPLSEGVTETDLVDRFIAEFNISDDERDILFANPASAPESGS